MRLIKKVSVAGQRLVSKGRIGAAVISASLGAEIKFLPMAILHNNNKLPYAAVTERRR